MHFLSEKTKSMMRSDQFDTLHLTHVVVVLSVFIVDTFFKILSFSFREHNNTNNYNNDNDLEVAHPQSGSSPIWLLTQLQCGNVGFWGEGKTCVPGEKPLGENQQQAQPTYGVDAGIWTRTTLVGGECSHHCPTLAPHGIPQSGKWLKMKRKLSMACKKS